MENGIKELLDSIIKVAKVVYPDTEFGYRKRHHSYCSGPRGRKGNHYTSVTSDPPEISKEEYDANVEAGKRENIKAFMGNSRSSYYTYEQYVKKDGWKELLKNDFQQALKENHNEEA